MGRKMAGFEVVNLKGWKCTNCGASGTAVNSNECSIQMKAHRKASPDCDGSKASKTFTEPSTKTESEVVQPEIK